MTTLLIKNAHCVATLDQADPARARELRGASVFIRDHRIEAIGLVNTHHHMYQSLTRAIPEV